MVVSGSIERICVLAWCCCACVVVAAACQGFDEDLLRKPTDPVPVDGGRGDAGPRPGEDGGPRSDAGEPECTGSEPTCTRPNAVTACVQGGCLLVECTGAFVDCDGDADNGCEATLDSLAHCGLCGAACALSNAEARCRQGRCEFVRCAPGFGNCDGAPGNGCEVELDSVTDCGGCGRTCPAPDNAAPGCEAGSCGVGACLGPFGDCDGEVENGCEQPLRDNAHCGGCDQPCAPFSAEGDCAGGTCAITLCLDDHVDCNGLSGDGCEATLDSAEHCGACGAACELPNTTALICTGAPLGCEVDHTCSGTGCVPGAPENGCAPGFGDCDGNPRNGCETPLDTLSDCGACGDECRVANGISECADGCGFLGCEPGFGACTSAACASLAGNSNHCGACGRSCGGATPNCAGGVCTGQTCGAGTADCNGQADDGCEAMLNQPSRCGQCNVSCGPYPNATAACTGGRCAIGSCNAGFRDCDGQISNGCEVNIRTLQACGGCAQPCAIPFAEESCASGSCTLVQCDPGRANCDGRLDNGCEASIALPENCGGCGNDCRGRPHVLTAGCEEGACRFVCEAGYGDCDGVVANGCEADFGSGTHCGRCDNDCTALPNVRSASCDDSVCTDLVCDPGWGDCDGNPLNGCERRLNTLSDCGACGRPCAPAHATGACVAGSCRIDTCDSGYADCNTQAGDGCEASLGAPQTCGSCTQACAQELSCVNGACACMEDADCGGSGMSCCGGQCVLTQGACFPWPCIPGTSRAATNCGGCGMTCLLWCCLTPP
jgi:hypothetical protein